MSSQRRVQPGGTPAATARRRNSASSRPASSPPSPAPTSSEVQSSAAPICTPAAVTVTYTGTSSLVDGVGSVTGAAGHRRDRRGARPGGDRVGAGRVGGHDTVRDAPVPVAALEPVDVAAVGHEVQNLLAHVLFLHGHDVGLDVRDVAAPLDRLRGPG